MALVWTLHHIETFGKHRTFASLLHGTMASAMPSAIGLQKCQTGRQVVCLAGDGWFAMLLGDLLTVVQERLPIKIVVYDNGRLDIEQKAAGLIPMYTTLEELRLRGGREGDGALGGTAGEGKRPPGVDQDLARAGRGVLLDGKVNC